MRAAHADLPGETWLRFDPKLDGSTAMFARPARHSIEDEDFECRDQMIGELRELIESTASDISTVHAEQAQLREELSEARTTIARQGKSVAELERTVNTHSARTGVQDREIEKLRRDLAESHEKLERRAEETADLRHTCDTLHSRKREIERELTAHEETRRRIESDLRKRDEAIAEFEREARSQRDEIASMSNSLEEATRTASKREAAAEAMQQTIAGLERNLVEECAVLGSLREEAENLSERLNEREATIEASNAAFALQRSDLEENRTEKKGLQERILGLESDLSERDGRIAELESERRKQLQSVNEHIENGAAMARELAQLRKVIEGNEQTARAADRNCSLLQRRIDSDGKQARNRDIEMAGLRQKLSDLEYAAEQRESARTTTETELARGEEAAEAARTEVEALRESLASAQRTIRAEEEQSRRFREGLSSAERTLADRSREISDLKEDLLETRTTLAERDQRLQELSQEMQGTTEAERVAADEVGPGERSAVVEDPGSMRDEIILLRERLQQRETEIETMGHVLKSANDRNTELRSKISERHEDRPHDEAVDETALTVSAETCEPTCDEAPTQADPAASPRPGWKIFPWKRGQPGKDNTPATLSATPEENQEAPEVALEPAVTGPPTFEVPPDGGTPVSDRADLPPIFHYWKRSQLESKLNRPGIESADDFFLSYLLDLCRRNPNRTNRIVSIGTGSHDLEVVIARRALDAGVRNFNIHCLSEVPSTLHSDRAIAAERTILANLTLLQCRLEAWNPHPPYSLVILNESLHTFSSPSQWVDRIEGALEPGGRVLIHSPIGRHDRGDSPVAREIASQIWQLMPELFKTCGSETTVEPHYAGAPRDDDEHPTLRAPRILPLLAERFGFEVFVAFGNVINAFIEGLIGANFDPERERDQRFIDQVASLDDGKIGSGLIAPTHLLAAMAMEASETLVFEHWTPDFCLAEIAGSEGVRDPSQATTAELALETSPVPTS